MQCNISTFSATGSALSEKRSDDRRQMAAILEQVITASGATYLRKEGGDYPGPQAIHLKVSTPRGLCVTVEVDGKSIQPDIHVLSWHMPGYPFDELNEATFGGNVNKSHLQKATYVAYGFTDLCEQLEKGLLLAVSGEAFVAGKGKNIPELLFLWDKLRDIPVSEDGALIDEAFLHFSVGTPCEDIWHWFESQNPRFVVGDVMQGDRPASDAVGPSPAQAANPPSWYKQAEPA